ncbi:MAG TPA: DNA topoisomerase IV subunit A [Polyangia bacterium]|nr:DNA topoisomerase IV subunit A [Polyangia bacterium]
MNDIPTISLSDETQRRYLNYALSVITSRALPDVRDGLKPVQRRILFAMYSDLRLTPDARYRKCAKVVGDVMGNYHPHGDLAIYDALVRLAQDFSLRYPLVDGMGNFGSLDGDSAAASRYTECKLQKIAVELLDEIKRKTVDWRPTYDGQKSEPVTLPARLPNLLVNGTQGIAVGMATSIPPHNLTEVVEACRALIDDGSLDSKDLLKFIKGPDFPTGGQVLASKRDLKEIYEAGNGSLKLRGEWELEEPKGRKQNPTLVITSIPYGPTKQSIVEKLGEVIRERKLPNLIDVLDQSTTDVRIELEIKKDADPALIMAYLYKNTALQTNVQVNLTCLVPTENPEVGRPERLSLKGCIKHFIDFRFEVVTKRFRFELEELERRIHILDGYAKIYDALDEVLRIIRKSEGKQDAAQKLMKRFSLDEEQVDAILELKLYRLARLEILLIQQELTEKKKDAKRLEGLLKSDARRWTVVKDELGELIATYGDKRRTKIAVSADEPEFDPTAYIVDEDANVVLTRDGWVKRVREIKDVSATRVREGDEVVAVLAGNTKSNVAFFTNYGAAYVCKVVDIPASTGYGDPVQKLFKFDDGERVVAGYSLDARVKPSEENLIAVSKKGYGLRFAIAPHLEVSTRSGRKFARPADGDELVGVRPAPDGGTMCVASFKAHQLVLPTDEINLLANPGRGVTVMKLDGEDDAVVGFTVGETLTVENEKGKTAEIPALKKHYGSRASKGTVIWTRKDRVARVVPQPVTVPELQPDAAKTEGSN